MGRGGAKRGPSHSDLAFAGPDGQITRTSSLRHFLDRDRPHYGIKRFAPGCLRHAIIIRMRETGIRPDIVEKIVGHTIDSGVIGIYSSYKWRPEMKDELTAPGITG